MKFFIPEINDLVSLTEDWTFDVYPESRNKTLINKFFSKKHEEREAKIKKDTLHLTCKFDSAKSFWTHSPEEREIYLEIHKIANPIRSAPFKMTIPKGQTLEIDRIYIRKGAEDFSSVTFKWIVDKKTVRFWVKLKDVNNLEVDYKGKFERWPEGKLFLIKSDKYIGLTCSRIGKSDFGFNCEEGGPVQKNSWKAYYRHPVCEFNSLDKLIERAKKENLPEDLINAFVNKHREVFSAK